MRPSKTPEERLQAKMASERRRARPGQSTNANHRSDYSQSSADISSKYREDAGGAGNVDSGIVTPEDRIRAKAAAGRRQYQQSLQGGRGGRSSYNNGPAAQSAAGRGRGRGMGMGDNNNNRNRNNPNQSSRNPNPMRSSVQVGAMSRQKQQSNNRAGQAGSGFRNSIQVAALSRPSSQTIETPEERLRRKISSMSSGGGANNNNGGGGDANNRSGGRGGMASKSSSPPQAAAAVVAADQSVMTGNNSYSYGSSPEERMDERVRRKAMEGRLKSPGSGNINRASQSGYSSADSFDTTGDRDAFSASQSSTPQERMEERVRRKAMEGRRKQSYASSGVSSGYSSASAGDSQSQSYGGGVGVGRHNNGSMYHASQQQYDRSDAEDLEDRVRAKAARAAATSRTAGGGGAAGADGAASGAGTATTETSTRFGGTSTPRFGGNSTRVNFLSPGVSERIQAKSMAAGGGRGGRGGGSGAKYDPRASAVGAYAVAGIGSSDPGRGRGRGRGRGGSVRGRGGRGGRSGRMTNGTSGRGRGGGSGAGRSLDGDSPSIFDRHTPSGDIQTVGDQSTIATNTRAPDDRDVFDNDRNDPEQAREMAHEERDAAKGGKKILCLNQTTVLMLALVLVAVIGAGMGAAARNGVFSAQAPSPTSSQTQDAPPPSLQTLSPTASPTPSPVARPLGPECQFNKLAGPGGGALSESTVAISGDIAAVGSYESGASGSVTIYVRDAGETWSEETTLSLSDVADFGRSIDLQDNVLVVGSTYVDDGGTRRGSVHVYERNEQDGEWRLLTRLVAEDALKSDVSFGSAVAVDFILDDDFEERRIQVLVGEPFGTYYTAGKKTGTVHIFTDISGGGWELQAKLIPGDGVDGDSFGMALDLANSRAVVANADGSVYSFEQDDERLTRWRQRSKIPPVEDPKFGISGSSVSIHHRTVAIGSGGIVRIFDFGRTEEDATVRPSGGEDLSSRAFGQNVALKDGTVIISAPPFGSAPGEARLFYVFEGDIGYRWEQIGAFESVDAGGRVAVDGSTILVGSQDGGGAFVAELC